MTSIDNNPLRIISTPADQQMHVDIEEAACPVCPADDHPGILEAIRVGDVERAVAAMDEHLWNVERTLWRYDDGARRVTVGAKGTE